MNCTIGAGHAAHALLSEAPLRARNLEPPQSQPSPRGPFRFDVQAGVMEEECQLDWRTRPVVIPPASGLRRIGFETFTADGPISYWNNYVGCRRWAATAASTICASG